MTGKRKQFLFLLSLLNMSVITTGEVQNSDLNQAAKGGYFFWCFLFKTWSIYEFLNLWLYSIHNLQVLKTERTRF